MSILESLLAQNSFWSIPSKRLPPNIRQYRCQFVSEEYQLNNQIKQRNYLKFTHPHNSSTFEIAINQVEKPSFNLYQAEIKVDDIQNPIAKLNNKFGSICFTDVKGYLKPPHEVKELNIEEDASFEYSGQNLAFLDFGDNQNQSGSEEDSSHYLIDFSPENQKFVRHQILMYIKEEANRFKKLKDIKAYLKTRKYNVPDSHLKRIMTDFCGSHIMDKKRGFLVHEEYLSPEEKVKRRLQDEQSQKKEKEKEEKKGQKKKATKKETKNDKKKMVISNEEVVKYAQGQQDAGSMRKIINQIKGKK